MPVQPVYLTTWWHGKGATQVGSKLLLSRRSALDAIEQGANVTEDDPEAHSVGYGGYPNADGVVELDAAIMDGPTHAAGSVGGLSGVGRAISVARRVMEVTPHVMLVGENARKFALQQGFPAQDQLTYFGREQYEQWIKENSAAVTAHFNEDKTARHPDDADPDSHDTIGLCALDSYGNLAAGCTTSGMAWKVPGRVGDSPIIGSGLYVDNEIGAVTGTGHGDEIMKACLSFMTVQNMGRGMNPEEACIDSLRYLMKKRPPEKHGNYEAALIAIRKDGAFGAAATRSGFKDGRLWQWYSAVGDQIEFHEGIYVTPTEIIRSLA